MAECVTVLWYVSHTPPTGLWFQGLRTLDSVYGQKMGSGLEVRPQSLKQWGVCSESWAWWSLKRGAAGVGGWQRLMLLGGGPGWVKESVLGVGRHQCEQEEDRLGSLGQTHPVGGGGAGSERRQLGLGATWKDGASLGLPGTEGLPSLCWEGLGAGGRC